MFLQVSKSNENNEAGVDLDSSSHEEQPCFSLEKKMMCGSKVSNLSRIRKCKLRCKKVLENKRRL